MPFPIGPRAALAAFLCTTAASAQTFDVASVKQSPPNSQPYANFPLGPGDVYVPNGGLLSATSFPLVTYLFFAYKIKGNEAQYLLRQLPTWTTTEHFDIQARAPGNPGKDDMRMMMRSLLADRFKLVVHNETREVPVLAFVLAKPGKLGPQIQPHPDDSPCPTNAPPPSAQPTSQFPSPTATVPGGFPALCNGIFGMPSKTPGQLRFGGRNVTIPFIADSFSATARLDRPMIDQTGLSGTFDFTLEFAMPRPPQPPGTDSQPDTSGPSFEQALQEQLGIKLKSEKSSISVLVVDHVEHPSEN